VHFRVDARKRAEQIRRKSFCPVLRAPQAVAARSSFNVFAQTP
jgi:hypothetical protein